MKALKTLGLCAALACSGFALTACSSLGIGSSAKVVKATKGPYDYQVMTLDNGMKVVTLEDPSTPLAAIQVWYHVGSKDERPDRRGFAHMFEHMMFRGTDRMGPFEHTNFLESIGGEVNAYTSFDQTVYVQEVPANQVEAILWMEAERMAFLKVDEEGFVTERQVVAEEYRQGAEQPYGQVLDSVLPKLFPGGVYSWSTIGDMDELNAATADELQKFWEQYYTPNNATLVVVGDVKHADVQRMAEKYFGWIPRYPDKPALAVPPAPRNTEPMKIKIKEKNGPVPIVAVVHRTVPMGHEDSTALELMGSILGGGESSRLYKRIVDDEELATVVFSSSFALESEGLFGVAAILSPVGSKQDKVLAAIREEIARFKTEGPTERELEKAKNNALRSAVAGQFTAAGRAQSLGTASMLMGDISVVNTQFDDIRNVTQDDIRRVANQYIDDQREIEIVIEPNLLGFMFNQLASAGKDDEDAKKDKKVEGEFAKLDRPSGKPGLSALRPSEIGEKPPKGALVVPDPTLNPHEKTLPNGLRVVVVPNGKLPFVTYSINMPYGAFTDPIEAPGTASMAAGLLTRGTETRTYEQLADELEYYAISVGGSVDMNSASVGASATTDQSERALDYLADITLRPTFPDEQFKKVAKQMKSSLAIEERSPDFLASRELRKRLYGDAHPYGRNDSPESKDLENITVEGMKSWWKTHVRPDTSTFYIAGDIAPERAFALVEKHFGAWKAEGAAPAYDIPAPPARQATHIYLVDKPGDQAQIRISQLLTDFDRRSPDYIATRLVNQYFGGGFNSRLFKVIRTEKGLTYSAFGVLMANRFAGSFLVSSFSKNATAAEAVQALIDEINRLRDEPPTQEEFEFSRDTMLGSFALSRETPQSLVEDLWLLNLYNLPKDYYQTYLSRIASAKPEEPAAAVRRLIDPSHLTVVVVGSAKELQADLEKIAPVTVVKP